MAITSIEVLDFRRYRGPTVLVVKFSQSNHFVPILPKLRSISSPPPPIPHQLRITGVLLLLLLLY